MTSPAYPEPAVSVCFAVKIDELQLGAFNSCEGLGIEVVLEQREEGGNNDFVWQLPTRLKFSNIKLTRPICADTTEVMKWLASMATGVTPKTANISAMTAEGKVVASWGLLGVIPVKWSGPSLNLDSPKVATETLELAHHGFTDAKPPS
ncbi:phage tail protein [Nocardioides guangzhouensis]|uniref:Phage tail protein n=1 Tax=Nocardioides guangzhouensis TaxID=2497878 RepID=A0A4Q4Z650_9ACTN|nr:phage tail protein [Nocardioides guangzhouensis]RYP83277.1 phage tail protein [Nocardioides guangzhouensis]